jgi:hypothetical protein
LVQEVRSILFSPEECHTAITTLLVMRIRNLRPERVMSFEIGPNAESATASLRAPNGTVTTQDLTAEDLMSAVLLFCRKANIPLSTRSHKRLTLIGGGLALTSSINLRAAAPTVEGGTIVHTLGAPDATMLHKF